MGGRRCTCRLRADRHARLRAIGRRRARHVSGRRPRAAAAGRRQEGRRADALHLHADGEQRAAAESIRGKIRHQDSHLARSRQGYPAARRGRGTGQSGRSRYRGERWLCARSPAPRTLLQAVKSPYHGDLIPEALRPQGQWVGTRVNIFTAVYNINLVKLEALPKSYADLLNPAFKRKLDIEADDYDWFGLLVGLLGEDTGLKLFRDIVATNGMSVRKGHTLLTNLVAAGEVPIGLTVFMQNADVAKKNGAPLDWFLIPPAVARPNGIALAKRAPHPHAALLFYDFMLSDGQQIMLKREFVPTSRKIPSVLNRIELNFVDPAIVLDGGAKWQKLYSEVVRKAGR